MNQLFYNKYGLTFAELEELVEKSLMEAEEVKCQFGTFYDDNDAWGRYGILGIVAKKLGYQVKYIKDWIKDPHLVRVKIPVKSQRWSFFPKFVSLEFNVKFYRSYGLKEIRVSPGVDMADVKNKIVKLLELFDKLVNAFIKGGSHKAQMILNEVS
jgi:hypothetical protein